MKYNDVNIQFDVPMILSDGTILRSNVYSSVAAKKLPVLLLGSPYDKNVIYSAGGIKPSDMAAKGFIVVVQDVRGRFASEGIFEPSVNEGSAPVPDPRIQRVRREQRIKLNSN